MGACRTLMKTAKSHIGNVFVPVAVLGGSVIP